MCRGGTAAPHHRRAMKFRRFSRWGAHSCLFSFALRYFVVPAAARVVDANSKNDDAGCRKTRRRISSFRVPATQVVSPRDAGGTCRLGRRELVIMVLDAVHYSNHKLNERQ